MACLDRASIRVLRPAAKPQFISFFQHPGLWLGALIALALFAANFPALSQPEARAGDGSFELSFPFPEGETWGFTAAISAPVAVPGGVARPALGYFLPTNSTYANDDIPGGQVVAMRGGTVSIPCTGMVQIDHGGGASTVYYPLASVSVSAGEVVTRGQALGITTTGTGSCGDSASGFAMVYIWMLQGTNAVNPVGKDIGGWEIQLGFGLNGDGCIKRGIVTKCRYIDPSVYPNPRDSVTNEGEIGTSSSPNAAVTMTYPSSVKTGDKYEYAIAGFEAYTQVTVTWRKPNGTTIPVETRTTNVAGAARGVVVIPETPGGGQNSLIATGGGITRSKSVVLRPYAPYFGPSLGRSNTLTVKVTGFTADASLPLTLALFGQSAASQPPLTSDVNGSAILTYLIPANAPLGTGTFTVTDPVTSIQATGYLHRGQYRFGERG